MGADVQSGEAAWEAMLNAKRGALRDVHMRRTGGVQVKLTAQTPLGKGQAPAAPLWRPCWPARGQPQRSARGLQLGRQHQ